MCKLGDVLEPVDRPSGRRDWTAERAPHLVLDTLLEHGASARRDAPFELVFRDVEADQERRMPRLFTPELLVSGREGEPGLRELERPDNPAPVVRMDPRRRVRVEVGEGVMGRLRPEVVVALLPSLARAGRRSRRQVELDERRPKVEPATPDDDGCQAVDDGRVDGAMRKLRVLADRGLVIELPDPDELRRMRRLVRQDRQPTVDLHRVG